MLGGSQGREGAAYRQANQNRNSGLYQVPGNEYHGRVERSSETHVGVHHHTGDTAGGQNHKTAEIRQQGHEESDADRTGITRKQVGEGTSDCGKGQEAQQITGARGCERTQACTAPCKDR